MKTFLIKCNYDLNIVERRTCIKSNSANQWVFYSTALILDPPDADGGEWCSPSLVAHSQTFPSFRFTAPLVAGSSDIEKCFLYTIDYM